MFTDGTVPTFGFWYYFRQRPPLDDYTSVYAQCFEEIEEAWARLLGVTYEQAFECTRLLASEVAPGVRDAVKT